MCQTFVTSGFVKLHPFWVYELGSMRNQNTQIIYVYKYEINL